MTRESSDPHSCPVKMVGEDVSRSRDQGLAEMGL